jgi:hypothetical protein
MPEDDQGRRKHVALMFGLITFCRVKEINISAQRCQFHPNTSLVYTLKYISRTYSRFLYKYMTHIDLSKWVHIEVISFCAPDDYNTESYK